MKRYLYILIALLSFTSIEAQQLDTILNGYLSPITRTGGSSPNFNFKGIFRNNTIGTGFDTTNTNLNIIVATDGKCYQLPVTNITEIQQPLARNTVIQGTAVDLSGELSTIPTGVAAFVDLTDTLKLIPYINQLPEDLQACIVTHNMLQLDSLSLTGVASNVIRNDSVFIVLADGMEFFTGINTASGISPSTVLSNDSLFIRISNTNYFSGMRNFEQQVNAGNKLINANDNQLALTGFDRFAIQSTTDQGLFIIDDILGITLYGPVGVSSPREGVLFDQLGGGIQYIDDYTSRTGFGDLNIPHKLWVKENTIDTITTIADSNSLVKNVSRLILDNSTGDYWFVNANSYLQKLQIDLTPDIDIAYFNTSTTEEVQNPGEVAWNDQEGTLDLGLLNGSVLQIGQEQPVLVKNKTGSTIPDGTPLRFVGTEGNSGRILVAPAIADGSYSSYYNFGAATQEILNDEVGYATPFGKVRGIELDDDNTDLNCNSEVWGDSIILYLDASTPGCYTKVKPTGANQKIPFAAIISAGNNGTMFVRPTLFAAIEDVSGVNIDTANLEVGQFLRYQNSLWENVLLEAGIIPVEDASGYYTSGNIEGALQEIGSDMQSLVEGGSDGDGIYDGNGTTPSNTVVTLTDNITIGGVQINNTQDISNVNTINGTDPSTYLTSEVDGSISNEGSLSVLVGASNTSVIRSNTSGSTDVTLQVGSNMTINESGNIITLDIIESQTAADITYDNTASGLDATNVKTALDEVVVDLQAIASGASDGVAESGTFTSGTELLTINVASPGSSFNVDLSSIDLMPSFSGWDTDVSDDFDGNYTSLDFTGTTGLSDGIDNEGTDDQTASEVSYDNSISGLSATNVGSAINELTVNLSNVDQSETNELQTISKVGSTVTLSNGGGSFTDAVNDADADASNELQTLSLAGTNLSISSGNTISLAGLGDGTGTDDQTAAEVSYDNADSGLSATNVKDALDELDSDVTANSITAGNGITNNSSSFDLGGTLTQRTTLDLTDHVFEIDGTNAPGDSLIFRWIDGSGQVYGFGLDDGNRSGYMIVPDLRLPAIGSSLLTWNETDMIKIGNTTDSLEIEGDLIFMDFEVADSLTQAEYDYLIGFDSSTDEVAPVKLDRFISSSNPDGVATAGTLDTGNEEIDITVNGAADFSIDISNIANIAAFNQFLTSTLTQPLILNDQIIKNGLTTPGISMTDGGALVLPEATGTYSPSSNGEVFYDNNQLQYQANGTTRVVNDWDDLLNIPSDLSDGTVTAAESSYSTTSSGLSSTTVQDAIDDIAVTPNDTTLSPTATTHSVNLGNKQNHIELISLTSTDTNDQIDLTVTNPKNGGVYTFHFIGADGEEIGWPSNFYYANETQMPQAASPMSLTASDFFTCYYSSTNSRFYCK
jgi:hypothetical protein